MGWPQQQESGVKKPRLIVLRVVFSKGNVAVEKSLEELTLGTARHLFGPGITSLTAAAGPGQEPTEMALA